MECTQEDKFLLLYVIIKMKLIQGKTLIFVNDVSRCFQLKLFLDRFGIAAVLLNAELPRASREHIIKQCVSANGRFSRLVNIGKFDILIATDEGPMSRKELDEKLRPRDDDESKKKKRKTMVEGFTITAAGLPNALCSSNR